MPTENADEIYDRAMASMQAKDWQQAADYWSQFRAVKADRIAGYLQGSRALLNLEQLTEAEAVLLEGIQRFPANSSLAARYATLSTQGQDWNQALERWAAFHRTFESKAFSYLQQSQALISLGRLDEADTLLAEAEAQWP